MTRFGLAATLALGALLAACKGSPAPTAKDDRPPPLPTAEVARGQDACSAYIKQVCACASQATASAGSDSAAVASAAALTEQCKLAEGIPDGIALSLDLANGSGVSRRDVLQAQQSVRHMVAECIEQTAKLPTQGCK
jgi:hypothetical protein